MASSGLVLNPREIFSVTMASSGLVLNPGELKSFPVPPLMSCGFHPHDGWPRRGAIVIFLATLGSKAVSSMEIFSSDTIASVKMRIQAFRGFYTNQQRLVHCGRELRGDNRNFMKDCGICSGEVVHLVLRLSDLVNVKVKTVSGAEYTFKVRKNQRVKYLKQCISEKEGGLDLEEQQLVFQGKRLEDHKRILDLHAKEDVVIHLLVERSATKVRSRSVGKDIELSISAAEFDSLIDNFSDVSVQQASFTSCIDYDVVELSAVSAPCDVSPETVQQVEPGHPLEEVHLSNSSQDFVLEPLRGFWECLRNQPDSLLGVLQQARSGLEAGHWPVLASEGSGGTYFLKDGACRNVAVFKPVDEEPEAVNNPRSSPRSSSNEGLKSGIIVGEGAMREVAAYLLDHPVTGCRTSATRTQKGYAGVPPTTMVVSSHKAYNYASGVRKSKVGSLQKYVHSVSNCEDMGPANFPADEVHKISVLDLRLANTDRNGGNILVCKREETSAINLVPIDHGYCLPDKFEDCTFEWLYWAQARVPFSAKTLEYISQLDADRDIYILGSHGIVLRPECTRVLRIATMLLKKGAAAGLTAFAMGSMMSREQFDSKSAIETMLETAEASVSPAAREDVFMDSVSQIMDEYIQHGMKFL